MKTILITGSSRGIGAATAKLAAKEGYNVIINYYQNKESADKLVDEIIKYGVKSFAIKANMQNEEEILALFERIYDEIGYIDVLVNNVGVLEKQTSLSAIDYNRLERMFKTNVYSYFICCREVINKMAISKGGRGGSIVNVSSIAAKTGAPNEYIDYAATKGAIDSLTIGLSKEVANEGIRVNGVRPGFIYTDIHASGGEANRIERLKESIPLKRGGLPEEVAEAIIWLASDKASFVTGNFIDITGGK